MISTIPQEVVTRLKQKPHHYLRGVVRALAPERALMGVFAQMTGSHAAAAALDQALMWQMVVERNPARDDGWWWKSDAEWELELLISKRQMVAVRKGLAGACVEMVKRARENAPQATWHYRVVWLGFFEALAVALATEIAKVFAVVREMIQAEDAERAAAEAALIAQIPQVTKGDLYKQQNVTHTGDKMSLTLTSYTAADSSSGVDMSQSPSSDARGRALGGFADPPNAFQGFVQVEEKFTPPDGRPHPPSSARPPLPSVLLTNSEALAMDMQRDTNCELSLSDCRALIVGYGEELCMAALRELRRQPRGNVRKPGGWLIAKLKYLVDPALEFAQRFDSSGQLVEPPLPY